MVERLELLQKFEQFLLQLPDGAYTVEQQAVMAADFASAREAIASMDKCRQEADEERLRLGLDCFTEKRRKSSRNRRH
ncbi:MAG: hypothetical protein AB9917_19800 [Negativicutes bacterium]